MGVNKNNGLVVFARPLRGFGYKFRLQLCPNPRTNRVGGRIRLLGFPDYDARKFTVDLHRPAKKNGAGFILASQQIGAKAGQHFLCKNKPAHRGS
jgi:hypothetical protein